MTAPTDPDPTTAPHQGLLRAAWSRVDRWQRKLRLTFYREFLTPIHRGATDYTADRRIAEGERLARDPALAGLSELSVVAIILAQTVKVAELKIAAVRALEGKAVAQIGIAGTVIGLFSAFGRHVDHGYSYIPLAILLVSIACDGVGIYIRRDRLPSPALLNTFDVISKPENASRVSARLVESWNDYSLDLGLEAGYKARWIRWGALLLVIGLIALLVTTSIASFETTPAPSVV